MNKTIYIFLFDGYSDWKIAYVAPKIQKTSGFELTYVSKNRQIVQSMDGLTITSNLALRDIDLNDVELFILPRGEAWGKEGNNLIHKSIN